jgi:broad specificity phosphatase PhoE
MTTFLLIRHASHDLLGNTLAGRAPDVHLNARGKLEAERLADRVSHLPIKAIYTGPLERSQESAWPLGMRFMLELRVHEGFDEIDFGSWTRKTFEELDPDPEWKEWNTNRGTSTARDGESMVHVQERIVHALERLSQEHAGEHVAVISHGDVIKAALLHYLGTPLDRIHQLEVSPASVTILTVEGGSGRITLLNDTGELPPKDKPGGRRRLLR